MIFRCFKLRSSKSLFKDNDILVSPKDIILFIQLRRITQILKGGYKKIHKRDLHGT